MELTFDIYFPGEFAAGLNSYTETVKIAVESGDPGGEPGEFAEHVRKALAEWFDGARVALGKPKPDFLSQYMNEGDGVYRP